MDRVSRVLADTRPTAVNLWAIERMMLVVHDNRDKSWMR